MYNSIVETLSYIGGFAIMTFITYIIILIVGFLVVSYAKERSLAYKYTLILYNLELKDMLLLNSHILKILFIIWLTYYKVMVEEFYLVFYVIMVILTLLLTVNPKRIISVLVTGLASLISLYIMSLLQYYNQEVYYLWTNDVIYYLFGIFVVTYNITESLRDVMKISEQRRFKDEEI